MANLYGRWDLRNIFNSTIDVKFFNDRIGTEGVEQFLSNLPRELNFTAKPGYVFTEPGSLTLRDMLTPDPGGTVVWSLPIEITSPTTAKVVVPSTQGNTQNYEQWKISIYINAVDEAELPTDPEPEPEPDPEPELTATISHYIVNTVLTAHNRDSGEIFYIEAGDSAKVPPGSYGLTVSTVSGYNLISAYGVIGDGTPDPTRREDFSIVDEDNASLNLRLNSLEYIEVRGATEGEEGVPDIVGTFNNLYKIDSSNLRKLTNQVVLQEQDNPIEHYIINLIRLPFRLPESIISINEGVRVGNSVFQNVDSNRLTSDIITIDLGVISVPEKYRNSYDFINTDCVLHLPYCSNIDLDPSYIIGHDIHISYVVNLYDGNGTVNVVSSKIDDVVHSEPLKVGIEIPYFNIRQDGFSHKNVNMLNVYNRLKGAYMEVIRNVPDSHNSNNEIVERSRLIYEKGFVEVNNIELNTSATLQEQDRIQTLLRQGVFIK